MNFRIKMNKFCRILTPASSMTINFVYIWYLISFNFYFLNKSIPILNIIHKTDKNYAWVLITETDINISKSPAWPDLQLRWHYIHCLNIEKGLVKNVLMECLVSLLTGVINVQFLVDNFFVIRPDESHLTLEQVWGQNIG